MQTRPAAVNPLWLRGFAAPASVAGQLRRRRINSKLTRRQEDGDSKSEGERDGAGRKHPLECCKQP
jgi:hypothetical protein